MIKRLLFVFFLIFSANSYSVTFSWGPSAAITFPTLQEAIASSLGSEHYVCPNYFNGGEFSGAEIYRFRQGSIAAYNRGNCGTSQSVTITLYRYGGECPAGQTLDAAQQQCVCPSGDLPGPGGVCANPDTERCAALAGTTTTVRIEGNINDANAAIGKSPTSDFFTVRQRQFNAEGCSADVGMATNHGEDVCVFKADGRYICNIQVGYDGAVSETGSASTGEATDAPVADSTSDTTQECTTPVVDAEGRHLTCYTTSGASQDGTSTCDRGEYDMYCHPAKPTPESETKTKEDQITEKSNPDGGKTTTTNTTTTTTYCKTGACNTSTTNNTSVKVTNGNGDVVSESSTCKGEDCPGGDGVDADGDGDGDFSTPDVSDFPNAEDALPKIGSDEDKTYEEAATEYMERIQEAPIVAAVTNISVPSGGSCNVGSVSLWGGSVSFNEFCSFAPGVLAGLRYIFLAIWAWAAVRLLLTA